MWPSPRQAEADHAPSASGGNPAEVFSAFLKLGLTSFGGPIAHVGYFRREFVDRRGWLAEAAFADLVALCQFLPGPASSQVGFAIGLRRAGPLGALAAWCAFTLPSALLMTALALGAARLDGPLARGVIHGLKLVAVAVVAQAVLGMSRALAPDVRRAAIATAALLVVTAVGSGAGQAIAILVGLLGGVALCRRTESGVADQDRRGAPKAVGLLAAAAFLVILLGGPIVAAITANPAMARFDAFYRSGALAFGGGHVVLPLLKDAVVGPGWVAPDAFLAGYGAAQAMPGPLFAFAAYLGVLASPPGAGLAGAALGLVAIFLPGLLILLAALPYWGRLQGIAGARGAIRGANAAVVGILGSALYDPLWTSSVRSGPDFAAAVTGFVALTALRWPPIAVVALGAVFGGLVAR